MSIQREKIVRLFAKNQPLFRALGDTHRQRILMILAAGERLSVRELTSKTELSRPAVSHHLRILLEAGLVGEERAGMKRFYFPTFSGHIEQLRAFVDEIEQAMHKFYKR